MTARSTTPTSPKQPAEQSLAGASCWASLPGMETRWLSRHDRHLPTPSVVYVQGLSFGGLYVPPWHEVQIVEGIEIPPSNGTIMIGEWGDEMPPAGILAHEWRHHWQQWNGWKYDGIGWNSPADYTTAIREYFTKSRSEMDALKYETMRASCDHSKWVLSICQPNVKVGSGLKALDAPRHVLPSDSVSSNPIE
jgi:hypothetical protein